MRARIEATASVAEAGEGSRSLAARAVMRCLESARADLGAVQLLLYAGIYHEGYVMEPAQAPLVQGAVGALTKHEPGAPQPFAFDVGSIPAAVEIAAMWIRCGRGERALVVESDAAVADPATGRPHRTPAASAALLAGALEPTHGFASFGCAAFPEHAKSFSSQLEWIDAAEGRGRHRLRLARAADMVPGTLAATDAAVRGFLGRCGVAVRARLLACAASPPELAGRVCDRAAAAMPGGTGRGLRALHRPRPLQALVAALEAGGSDDVLWVCVEPGVVVHTALYESERPR